MSRQNQSTQTFSIVPVALLAALVAGVMALTVHADDKSNNTKTETPSKQGVKAVATTKRQIDPKKITWLNFSDGLKFARAEKKHVLLDFTATWCGWCKKMDAETFSDSTVIQYINSHFVPVKVWGDSEEKLDIDGYLIPQSAISQEMFKVQGFPTFHFLRPSDQKLVRGFSGYRQRDDMLRVLEFVKEEQYDTTKAKNSSSSPSGGKGR